MPRRASGERKTCGGDRAAGGPVRPSRRFAPRRLRRARRDGAAAACVRGRSGRPQARRASLGIQDNRERAHETADPYDTADALSASGRQVGYAVDFSDTDLSALLDGGVFAAGSWVELFATPESASASIVRELAELQRAEGDKLDGEVRIERVRTFATDLPEAIGFRVQERLAGKLVWRTYVRLRHGSIVGTAALVRADRRDVQDRVAELARALERRIDGVLDGRIAADAAPFREGADEPAAASSAS